MGEVVDAVAPVLELVPSIVESLLKRHSAGT